VAPIKPEGFTTASSLCRGGSPAPAALSERHSACEAHRDRVSGAPLSPSRLWWGAPRRVSVGVLTSGLGPHLEAITAPRKLWSLCLTSDLVEGAV